MAEKVQANPDKLKVLNAVMEKIEKDFGKGSIMRMNSQEVNDVPVIPTGSITLDMALGVGGYPKGRVVEIYGPESSGKTTLAIHAIAEAQRRAASQRSSTPSMPSTATMPRNSGWMWITSSSRSPTTASRRSKSPTR